MLASCLLCLGLAAAPSPTGEVSTHRLPIREVIVFQDRAQVIRRGSIACERSQLALRIDALPGRLEPESVRVEYEAGVVLSVATQTRIGSLGEERGRLEGRAKELERRTLALEDAIHAQRTGLNKVESYGELAEAMMGEQLRSPRPPLKAIADSLSTLRQVADRHADAELELRGELVEVGRVGSRWGPYEEPGRHPRRLSARWHPYLELRCAPRHVASGVRFLFST